jgi:RimJ/RimL family protein N-acetyltransferase
MTVNIREAHPEDAEKIIAYVQQLADEPENNMLLTPGEFRLTLEEEQKILADFHDEDNSVFLVAEEDGEIIGTLNLRGGKRKAIRHAATLGMSVNKERRSQGIGGRLMEEAISWAKAGGILKRIELFVFVHNLRAIHLYLKFGFEVEGRRRMSAFKDGEYLDDYLMALLL